MEKSGLIMPITQAQSDKYSIFTDGSYPIFNRKTAISALRLRGRGNLSKANRRYLIKEAARYAPREAEAALLRDRKAKKV